MIAGIHRVSLLLLGFYELKERCLIPRRINLQLLGAD